MTGSSESASTPSARVLVCGVNWVGDCIMSMPGIQAYAAAHPDHRISVLAKPSTAALWHMHPSVAEVIGLEPGTPGVFRTAGKLRGRFDAAYVLPHSFRSALVPFWARIPNRSGLKGHSRDFMLHRTIAPQVGPGREHQAWEYMDLLAPEFEGELPAPVLAVPADAMDDAAGLLGMGESWVGLIPGAARGPSKQWPRDHFMEAGERLGEQFRVAVIGAPGEEALCGEVADGIGEAAVSLAGRLSFAVWAAVLKQCRVVVANDSGGMHLAAALGTPVVALFGHTDPARTGPLGPARILQNSTHRSRDIARDSEAARLSLASIPPGDVYEAVMEVAQNET